MHFSTRYILAITCALTAFIFSSGAFAQQPPPPPYNAEIEAGTVMVTGNSDSQSYATKGVGKYKNGYDSYLAFGHYIQIKANGVESALNWDAGLRYEREINTYLAAILGYKGESDVYAGYIQRDSTDVAFRYYLTKSDTENWSVELGYRYAKTQPRLGAPLYESFVRAYSEYSKSFTETYTFKLWAEYLPNLTNNTGYQVNSEASIKAMLTSVLSLKIGYLIQYLNVPPSGGKYSTTTSTLNLVAKF